MVSTQPLSHTCSGGINPGQVDVCQGRKASDAELNTVHTMVHISEIVRMSEEARSNPTNGQLREPESPGGVYYSLGSQLCPSGAAPNVMAPAACRPRRDHSRRQQSVVRGLHGAQLGRRHAVPRGPQPERGPVLRRGSRPSDGGTVLKIALGDSRLSVHDLQFWGFYESNAWSVALN